MMLIALLALPSDDLLFNFFVGSFSLFLRITPPPDDGDTTPCEQF